MTEPGVDGLPIAIEYPEAIVARMLGTLNAGLEPDDPTYEHEQGGGWASGILGARALEDDRLYDRIRQILVAAHPSTATGVQLERWATLVRLTRKPAVPSSGVVRFTGAPNKIIPAAIGVSTESPSPDADPVSFRTLAAAVVGPGGFVDVAIQAEEPGTIGNVPANSVTILDSLAGVTIANALPITGGDDVESDERLQTRVMRKFSGTSGAGNVEYYVNLMLDIPGIGYATVQTNAPARGDVRVVIADVNNDPVSSVLLGVAQARVDPSGLATQGAAAGPVGAKVVVTTPTGVPLAITATLLCAPGYSVTGAGGTIAVGPDVQASIREYVDDLIADEDVRHTKGLGAIVAVEGVIDVSNLNMGAGVGQNVTILGTEVAVVGSIVLS